MVGLSEVMSDTLIKSTYGKLVLQLCWNLKLLLYASVCCRVAFFVFLLKCSRCCFERTKPNTFHLKGARDWNIMTFTWQEFLLTQFREIIRGLNAWRCWTNRHSASATDGSCHKDVKMFDILTNGEHVRGPDAAVARNRARPPPPTPSIDKIMKSGGSDLHQCQYGAAGGSSVQPRTSPPPLALTRTSDRRVTRSNLDIHVVQWHRHHVYAAAFAVSAAVHGLYISCSHRKDSHRH